MQKKFHSSVFNKSHSDHCTIVQIILSIVIILQTLNLQSKDDGEYKANNDKKTDGETKCNICNSHPLYPPPPPPPIYSVSIPSQFAGMKFIMQTTWGKLTWVHFHAHYNELLLSDRAFRCRSIQCYRDHGNYWYLLSIQFIHSAIP